MIDRRAATLLLAGVAAAAFPASRPMSATAEEATPAHDPTFHHGGDARSAHARSTYAGTFDPDAAIRSLSPEQVAQILAGQGAGFALPAELNGVPGPRHVLDLGPQLGLTPEQRAATQAAFDEMRAAVLPAGERYLAAVAALEADLRTDAIAARNLPARVAEVYRLEGDLAAAHLRAHLGMADLLSPEQRAAYNRLRGYAG